jgi:hypothetical protein
MWLTYLTTEELSGVIKYDGRTIRERLKDSVLIEGIHYIRPFGGRKIYTYYHQAQKIWISRHCGQFRATDRTHQVEKKTYLKLFTPVASNQPFHFWEMNLSVFVRVNGNDKQN